VNTWTPVAGWALVHFVGQGAVIGLVAGAILRAMRRARPQARYVVACAALAAMLAAPLVTAAVLSGPVDLLGSSPARRSAPPRADDSSTPALFAAPAISRTGEIANVPASTPAAHGWQRVVVASWLAGVAMLVARLLGGWWRVRRLHGAALAAEPSRWAHAGGAIAAALGIGRLVRIVDWPAIDTPAVVGWARPVVLLPVAALSNLTPAQVQAILAHELAHIRRHDFVANLLQTVVETLLFYHPAVWWLSTRIRTEREHCCDLVAVNACGDSVSYAEALTELETWRTAETSLALAATGGPLVDRVRRILGQPVEDASRVASLASLAVVGGLLLLMLGGVNALGAAQPLDQSPAGTPASPDAVDAEPWSVVFSHTTSELRFIGFSGRDLVRFAHQFPGERVVGGPSWIDTETFSLAMHLDGPPSAGQMPSIVRGLLEERFMLQTHVETRDVPVYALVMARSGAPGPNLQVSTTDCFDTDAWIASGQPPRDVRLGADRQPICGEEAWDSSISRKSFVAISMAQFAERLGGFSELASIQGERWPRTRDVVDRTGLTGRFDVSLRVFRPAAALMGEYHVLRALLEPLGFLSMPAAVEQQLGLTLEDATAPYEVIVIDNAERPGG
jgi:uncharacterized protein (TIGR03435 family)